MPNTIKILLILLVCFFSCKNSTDKEEQKHLDDKITIDENAVILLNSNHNEWLEKNYGYQQWEPNVDDLKIVQEVIEKAIQNDEFYFLEEPLKANIEKYYRQYIPYINENGERIIKINAFCKILESPPYPEKGINEWTKMDSKNHYISVDDGGDCFWRITINIDKREYKNLMVNGVA